MLFYYPLKFVAFLPAAHIIDSDLARDIAILPGEVHTYTLDKEALLKGQDGTFISIDRNGDGKTDRTLNAGLSLTATEFNEGATQEELNAYKNGNSGESDTALNPKQMTPEGNSTSTRAPIVELQRAANPGLGTDLPINQKILNVKN